MIFIDPKLWQVASGTPIGNVDVGDIVQLRENLVPVDYIVVHQGLPSSMYDASCDGTWLLRKDIAENREWNDTNVNDYENSTINSYLSSLRAVYNAAVGEGLVDGEPNPFAGLRLKREITAKRAVPASVVEEMARLDLNDNPEWQRAVDLALFAFCAFGMPFVDVVCLRKADIHDGEIVYRRRKTSAEIRIGVTPAMKALFRRYANNTPYVFPLEQEDIERQGYAAYKLLLAKHNRVLARVAEQVGATTRLTSYVMRHTWASEALANDVSVAIISQALGHSSEQTTRCYLKQLDRSALDEANDRVTGFLNKYIG